MMSGEMNSRRLASSAFALDSGRVVRFADRQPVFNAEDFWAEYPNSLHHGEKDFSCSGLGQSSWPPSKRTCRMPEVGEKSVLQSAQDQQQQRFLATKGGSVLFVDHMPVNTPYEDAKLMGKEWIQYAVPPLPMFPDPFPSEQLPSVATPTAALEKDSWSVASITAGSSLLDASTRSFSPDLSLCEAWENERDQQPWASGDCSSWKLPPPPSLDRESEDAWSLLLWLATSDAAAEPPAPLVGTSAQCSTSASGLAAADFAVLPPAAPGCGVVESQPRLVDIWRDAFSPADVEALLTAGKVSAEQAAAAYHPPSPGAPARDSPPPVAVFDELELDGGLLSCLPPKDNAAGGAEDWAAVLAGSEQEGPLAALGGDSDFAPWSPSLLDEVPSTNAVPAGLATGTLECVQAARWQSTGCPPATPPSLAVGNLQDESYSTVARPPPPPYGISPVSGSPCNAAGGPEEGSGPVCAAALVPAAASETSQAVPAVPAATQQPQARALTAADRPPDMTARLAVLVDGAPASRRQSAQLLPDVEVAAPPVHCLDKDKEVPAVAGNNLDATSEQQGVDPFVGFSKLAVPAAASKDLAYPSSFLSESFDARWRASLKLPRPMAIGGSLSISSQENLKQRLIALAEAVTSKDQALARVLMERLKQEANPMGDVMQRVVYYFLDALYLRSQGLGAARYAAPPVAPPQEFAEAMEDFGTHLPFFSFSIAAMSHACAVRLHGFPRIHIVDFESWEGAHWPHVLRQLCGRPPPPPAAPDGGCSPPAGLSSLRMARITILLIGGGQAGGGAAGRPPPDGGLQHLLADLGVELGIQLEYREVVVEVQDISRAALGVVDGEAVAVCSALKLQQIYDGPADHLSMSPRDTFLKRVLELRPALLTLAEGDCNLRAAAPFLPRFRAALDFFAAEFASHDAAFPRSSRRRHVFERDIVARDLVNAVACEGATRVLRWEAFPGLRARLVWGGWAPLASPGAGDLVREVLAPLMGRFAPGWSVAAQDGAAKLMWKGRPMMSFSAWVPGRAQ